MKKHTSFKQVHREEKRSKAGMYMSIFLAVVMIGGIGGVMLQGDDNGYNYGKYSFTSSKGIWLTKINGKQLSFYNLPQEVELIDADEGISTILKNSQGVIILFDPENITEINAQALDVMRFDLTNALMDKNKQVIFATTKNSSYDFPVLSCENSSYYSPILYTLYSNETSIRFRNTCIIASATDAQDLIRISDNLRYRLYGVLNEKEN